MTTKYLQMLILLPACLFLACGDSDPASDTRSLITWFAGDADFFGCPYVIPEPWTSFEEHDAACGEGCSPLAGNGISTFVACISEDMNFSSRIGNSVDICLTHPVTRDEYTWSDTANASGLRSLCWIPCEDDLFASEQPVVPDECFEEVDP